MTPHRAAFLSALVIAFCAVVPAAAPAQSEILKVDWELSRLRGKERTPYAPVAELRASPELKFSDHLRALVTLRNPAAKPVEGVVLRYSVRMKLLRKGDAPEKAFWGVPFYTEEIRVSKINPGSERQARIIHFDLPAQLRKLRNSGFSPEELKLEIMVCPRQGDEPGAIMREAVINIVKP
ncbi:MAG: hypothetical protein A2049_07315 [Elusimicrobia bacterium GWA2_62_23]|nr:MAG: hypothetical protein A2049_07315 [Elusimicrobia bacterium GWA2_62_23]OGR73057.1 MAG: hypothetical protein A2179_01100 [Elusimicrobia bacterium GWC2_63_65]